VPYRPNQTVQTNLRMKESLRRKIEREAQKHGISFNKECLLRIEASFQSEAVRELDAVAQDIQTAWFRFSKWLEGQNLKKEDQ
jgi:Arc-like DNA binding domain